MPAIKRIISLFILFASVEQHIHAQSILLRGRVTDANGKSVVAASVIVLNSKQETSSDAVGKFNVLAKDSDSIRVSAISFGDTTISVNMHKELNIVLQPDVSALKQVTSGLPSLVEITRALFIADAFDDYRRAGVSIGGLNSGLLLPIISFNGNSKRSPYLLDRFVNGIIVDQNNNIINDSTNLLNFDKENCQLVITKDKRNCLAIDKEKVVAFALKTKDSCYVFMNVPILNKTDYFLLIGNGTKYSVYKSIKSRLVKSNEQSEGLSSSGNNLDEYIDQQTYYGIDEINRIVIQFEPNKKSLRSSFVLEKKRVNEYFIEHKSEVINDYFMRGFVAYLNR